MSQGIFAPGQNDPRWLTRGPGLHAGSHAGQVDPARPAPKSRRRPAMGSATACGEERGGVLQDRGLTGDTPGRSAWPEDGRRWRIRWQRSSVSSKESTIWRQSRGRGFDSFSGETEDGEVDLLSFSEEHGVVSSGGERRRPWRLARSLWGEVHGRERERPEREREEGRKGGIQVRAPRGSPRLGTASRRWPCLALHRTRRSLLSLRRRQWLFCK
jgi:hypothetical protein